MWKNYSVLKLLQILTHKLLISDSDKFVKTPSKLSCVPYRNQSIDPPYLPSEQSPRENKFLLVTHKIVQLQMMIKATRIKKHLSRNPYHVDTNQLISIANQLTARLSLDINVSTKYVYVKKHIYIKNGKATEIMFCEWRMQWKLGCASVAWNMSLCHRD